MKTPIITACLLTSTALLGQNVLGVGNFIHVVQDLDRSIEFYRDGLGLEMTGASEPRAFSANAVVSSLYDAPGAQSRVASFRIPDSPVAVEIVEFQGLNAAPSPARFFDVGAVTLTLPTQDLEAAKTRLLRVKGFEWVSAQKNSVTVRDPDGIFVTLQEPLRQLPERIVEARLGVVVEDLAATRKFYSDTLGFYGNKTMRLPGDGFPVDFAPLNYAERKPLRLAIHDPGAGVLRLRVTDFDAVLRAMTGAGATVVSTGGQVLDPADDKPVSVPRCLWGDERQPFL